MVQGYFTRLWSFDSLYKMLIHCKWALVGFWRCLGAWRQTFALA